MPLHPDRPALVLDRRLVKDGAFAMLTTPGPEVALYDDRQIVVLPPGAGAYWFDLSAPEDLILTPSSLDSLLVEQV